MKFATVPEIIARTKHANNSNILARLWRFACIHKMDVVEAGTRNLFFCEADADKLVALLDAYAEQHPKNMKKGL